jgi:hypothetical protein
MCLHAHWYFRRNDYSNLSFFLVIMREDDDAHDSVECVLNWRWLGGQSHCYTLVCDVALLVGVGVNFLTTHGKLHNAINFCGIHSVWGGLGSWTRSKQHDEVIPHTATGQFSLHTLQFFLVHRSRVHSEFFLRIFEVTIIFWWAWRHS